MLKRGGEKKPATHGLSVSASNRMEALGLATAGIIHDINNELTVLLNHLATGDLAPGDPLLGRLGAAHLEGARAAATRCAELSAGLLGYCKGNSLALCPLDPVDFIGNYAHGLQLPAGVRLQLETPPALPPVACNAHALRRVLDNLVLNACQAMKNSGTLTLHASGSRIRIQDSGPGISPADAPRIFQPFFSTKRECGTGLGLTIARDLMRRQGGALTLEAVPGRGAAFELRFREQ
jgi:signal transduction histidine kinase